MRFAGKCIHQLSRLWTVAYDRIIFSLAVKVQEATMTNNQMHLNILDLSIFTRFP